MRNIFAMMLSLTMLIVGYDIASAQINAFPSYKEDFESGTGGGWSPSGQNSSWELGYPSKEYLYNPASGEYCWATGLYRPYNTGELSYLTSPALDFSCYTSDPTIEFSLYYFTEAYPDWGDGYDFCWAEYSTNGGSTWQVLGSAGTGKWWHSYYYDYTNSTDREAWGGDADYYIPTGWVTAQNKISGAAGKNNVRIRFVMSSDPLGYELDGMAIDDINIYTDNPTLAIPTLLSPANAAINQPMRPALSWGSIPCATGYDLQVATDASFSSPVINITNNATTSFAPATDLAAGTLHYWRTRARSASMLSAWSAVRTFTTQFPPPPIPVLAAPTNSSTAQPLAATLSWLVSAGAASYQLQVSTNSAFSTTLIDQTLTATSFTFTAPNNFTTYYWRVNASNAQGTSSWSNVWSFRTIIGTPMLTQPTSNLKGLTTPITTSWTSVPGAIYYELQIAKDASFTTLSYNGNISGLSTVLQSLSKNTQYFWRARAAADAIERGNWSDVWNFSTMVGTPGLMSPFDASLDLSPQKITFLWNAVEGEATYRIQIAKDILFADIVADTQNVKVLTLDLSKFQTNTLYYWRVRAMNPVNGLGSWTDSYTFTTIVGKVTGVAPANDQKGVPISVPLIWSSAGSGKTYKIQIATDLNFKNIVVTDEKIGEITGTYGYNTGLKDYTKYYWHVRPLAQTNAEVPWSETMSFTTNIGAPVLYLPANGAVNQPIATSLAWKVPAGAIKYTVRVFEDDAAQTLVFEDDAVMGTTVTPTGIKPETKYIWMVQAFDADGFASKWSAAWKFATTTVFASVPALEKPENNSPDAPLNPTLIWKAADYAQTYDVQVSSYSNFSSTIINLTGVSDITLPLNGLSNGERYFWRVRAVNAAGASAWSETWTFVVAPLTPAMVTLVSPPNGADRQEQSPTLRWNEVEGALSYQLQVSDNPSFSNTLVDKSGLLNTVTTYNVGGLKPKTSYVWRVRAVNAIGEGPWSETWSFTTDEVSGVNEDFMLTGARLEAVYPNPASHEATIAFTLTQPATASITIVNSIGETVATVATGEFGEGQHKFNWNVAQIPSGVYAVRLTIGKAVATQTLNITK